MNDLYDTDVVLWSEHQAELLHRRGAGELVNDGDLDWPNLAEEIEAVRASAHRELRSRPTRLILHLLKWQYHTELRSRSWRTTIRNQRREIADLLDESPSMQGVAVVKNTNIRRAIGAADTRALPTAVVCPA